MDIIEDMDLQRPQNIFFSICKKRRKKIDEYASNGKNDIWIEQLKKLGHYLDVKLPCEGDYE
jgi:hypothetical protein